MASSPFFVDLQPLRRFRAFRRLWVGYAIRQIGAQLTATTVIYQTYAISHSNLDVGLVSLAQLVPAAVAPIFGGALVDALDRRKLLAATAVLMALSTTGLALNSQLGHPALWPLFLLSGLTAGLAGVDNPARTAAIFTLVDRQSVVAANVLRQLLFQLASVAGPSLAGVVIALSSHDLAPVYWLDVASTLAALYAVLLLPRLLPEGGGRRFGLASIGEGFAFLRGRRNIQACFIADLNAMVLGMPTSLFPYWAAVHFHGGGATFGLLTAAPGIGALAGSLLSGWTGLVRRLGLAVIVAITIWGAAIAAFGVVPWLPLALVLLAIAGWADVISAVFRSTIIQLETPGQLTGRLFALQTAVVTSGPRLGNTEAGVVAALANAQVSIVSGGLGCLLGIAAIARAIPSFARFDLSQRQLGTAVAGAEEAPPGAEAVPAGA